MAYPKRIRAGSKKKAERKFKEKFPDLIFDKVGRMFSWYKHRYFSVYFLPTPPPEKPPEVPKKEKPPEKPKEEFEDVGIDTETGFLIKYSTTNQEYVLFDGTREIKRSNYLEITETLSIETGSGHETPFVCELTSRTNVGKMNQKQLAGTEDSIQETLDKFFHEQKGLNQIKKKVIKTGVEYRLSDKQTYPKVKVIIEKSQPRKSRILESEVNA
jgi:hypothetical protein